MEISDIRKLKVLESENARRVVKKAIIRDRRTIEVVLSGLHSYGG